MSHEVKIHPAQTSILRELLFHPAAGYAKLQKPTGLSSDHFNFHIKRLLELGYVEKVARGNYRLTLKGKEYANRLDTDQNAIERQPKVAVLLGIEKTLNRRRRYLFQQRTKNPWYGYWGFPTGKIRWGETILQAAERELLEETGLKAGRLEIKSVYHERVFLNEAKHAQEDKIFFIVSCKDLNGKLITAFEGGRNVWHSEAQARKLSPRYASFEIELNAVADNKADTFVEQAQFYDKDQF